MIPLYKTSQIRELDNFAISALGVPGPLLMENAALGIIEAINDKFDLKEGRLNVGIACGKGNNGGDGFAVARHLSNLGHKVKLLYFGSEKEMSDDCKLNFSILKNLAESRSNLSLKKFTSARDIKHLAGSQVIIDSILGSGFSGELKAPYSEVIKYLNSLKTYRIAIDIPSGLNADTGFGESAFNADLTITLGDFKTGLFIGNGYEHSGEIILKEIGIGRDYLTKYPVTDYLIEPEDALTSLPEKSKSVNKYSSGKVFVVAGSGKYPGAAVLTCRAAFKSGAGSVILAFPEDSRKLIQKNLTEVVFQTYESKKNTLTVSAVKSFNDNIKWADVIALGPGISREHETTQAVEKLIRSGRNKHFVVDADAVYALGNGVYKNLSLKKCVLTPHMGEFSNLIDVPLEKIRRDLLAYGKGFAVQTECYLVLKGAPTVIFTPSGEALINTVGNPGMAKFGTGDVLTGMISSFIAQTKDMESGIIAGVYLHSLAADLLLNNKTEFGMEARDIIDNIPGAISFLRKSFDQLP